MSDFTSIGSTHHRHVVTDASATGQADPTVKTGATPTATPSVSTSQAGLPNTGGTQQSSQEETVTRLLRRNRQRVQDNLVSSTPLIADTKGTKLSDDEISNAFQSFSQSSSSGKSIAALLVPLIGMLQVNLREQAWTAAQTDASLKMDAADKLKDGAAEMRKGALNNVITASVGAFVGTVGSGMGLKWGGQISSAAAQSAAQGINGGGSYEQMMAQARAQEMRAESEKIGANATLAGTFRDTSNSQQQSAAGTNNAILSLVNELIRNEQEGKQAISSKFR